jgi:glycosyltransferase involved in cell wall biosynthesis
MMPPQPFFSVVIPTKDRPSLLRDALWSAVHQDFSDYEVIVSDNFNDASTREAAAPFLDDRRVRYIRTGADLSMPAHWEWATAQARGRYILVVTDRSVLMQGALARIHRALGAYGEDVAVCSWRWSLFEEAAGILYGDGVGGSRDRGRDTATVLSSERIARVFVDHSGEYPFALPRGLNSCYRHDAAQRIRDRLGGLFVPVSPDFTSAFLLLAHIPGVLHIDDALFISQGLRVSNGGRGVAATCAPYLETLATTHAYDHVPIKAAIVENVIFNDFLAVQRRAGGYLAGVRANWVAYFVACYRELLEKEGAGLLGAAPLADMFAAWEAALAGSDAATRAEVAARLSRLGPLRAKALVKRTPLGPVLVGLKRRVAASRPWGPSARYQSALVAAGFEAPTHPTPSPAVRANGERSRRP